MVSQGSRTHPGLQTCRRYAAPPRKQGSGPGVAAFHQSLLTSHMVSSYPSHPRNPINPAAATTINGLTLVKMKTAAQTAVRR